MPSRPRPGEPQRHPESASGPADNRPADLDEGLARLRGRLEELRSRPLPEPPAPRPSLGEHAALLPAGTAHEGLNHRFGLVLAGGAAKGAYQVGAVECLAHSGLNVAAFAGTSIGALNVVTLAAAPSLREGAARLAGLWTDFTRAMGAPPFGAGSALEENTAERLGNLAPRIGRLIGAGGELERMVDRAIDAEALRTGVPARVAVYPMPPPRLLPHENVVQQAREWLMGMLGRRSRILHLNGLSHEEIKQAVLASCALPFLFKSRSVAGQYYRDGMLGRDNTPIRALADVDHCDIVIVVHLSPGETVRRTEHPGLTLLQIRPSGSLTPSGGMGLGWGSGMLDFSPAAFERLRRRGYEDAERMLAQISGIAATAARLRAAEAFMADRVSRVLRPR